jgi:hypothetical protein
MYLTRINISQNVKCIFTDSSLVEKLSIQNILVCRICNKISDFHELEQLSVLKVEKN